MDLKLRGKRAIVTGGSRGIGRCCALALAREGARVCVTARNRGLLDEVVGEIEAAGGEGHAVTADLTSLEGCRKVVREAAGALGGIDILVNCAGAARGGDILELPAEQIDEGLALKAHGYLRMSQLVIPNMRENRWGRIVHIAGSAGTSPGRGNIPLSLSNIAVLNCTRALSDAVSGDGILVNAICPGMTNTQRARDLAAGGGRPAGARRRGTAARNRREASRRTHRGTGGDRRRGRIPRVGTLFVRFRHRRLHGWRRAAGNALNKKGWRRAAGNALNKRDGGERRGTP